MATRKPSITVRIARELKLSSRELATLKKAFKMDLTRVLRARPRGPGDLPVLPDVNVGGSASGSKKAGSKKSAKTGSSKKK